MKDVIGREVLNGDFIVAMGKDKLHVLYVVKLEEKSVVTTPVPVCDGTVSFPAKKEGEKSKYIRVTEEELTRSFIFTEMVDQDII